MFPIVLPVPSFHVIARIVLLVSPLNMVHHGVWEGERLDYWSLPRWENHCWWVSALSPAYWPRRTWCGVGSTERQWVVFIWLMGRTQHQLKGGSLLGLTLGRWCCSGASWYMSRAQQLYFWRNGEEEGQAPSAPLPSLLLTAGTTETREGFILKHPYVSLCLLCWNTEKGGSYLKDKLGLLKGFHTVIFFTHTHIHWYLQFLKFGQFWKIREAFLVWKLVGSNEWRELLEGSAL